MMMLLMMMAEGGRAAVTPPRFLAGYLLAMYMYGKTSRRAMSRRCYRKWSNALHRSDRRDRKSCRTRLRLDGRMAGLG
jgi:hypothetical protein